MLPHRLSDEFEEETGPVVLSRREYVIEMITAMERNGPERHPSSRETRIPNEHPGWIPVTEDHVPNPVFHHFSQTHP